MLPQTHLIWLSYVEEPGSAKVLTISTSLTVAGATFSISVRNWDIIFLCQQLSTKLINSLAGEARQFCGISVSALQ